MTGDVKSIGIVGAGPKGLYGLERLAVELSNRWTGPPPHIHVFEPHPSPGAGPVYDPSQPHYLRLNFANENIDAWSRSGEALRAGPRLTFLEWLQNNHPAHADPTGYAPRAMVGQYLNEVFRIVVAELRALTTVEIHPLPALRISSRDGRFTIESGSRVVECDEVLVATGHASQRSQTLLGSTRSSLGPYPIDSPGGVGEIEPGAVLAVRGMGLTAIDVSLALTEGRGGEFEPVDNSRGRLTYHGTQASPGIILPFSRTGRPMVPKDHPEFGPNPDLAHANVNSGDRLQRCIVDTAARALTAATGRRTSATDIDHHLATLLERRPLPASDVLEDLTKGVDVAYGRCDPGPDWALGTAWRALYPAIVDLAATRRLDAEWPRFWKLAVEMERVAFGPPAENAARFAALVEAGVVDLSMASGPTLAVRGDGHVLELDDVVQPVDDVVDAVLAPPGASPNPSPLIASLITDGLARPMPDAPGIEVQPDGTCIGSFGRPTVGLAVMGRPTEGCILGNDTLSRKLHDTPSRWARTVVDRLTVKEMSLCN